MRRARQAVILAAGVGSRLRPITEGRPKALVPLNGRPLLDHALDALAAHGVRRVTVVVGYAAEAVARHAADRSDLRITCVENPRFATTNTLASVASAAPAVEEADLLLLDGDLVFEIPVLDRLAREGTWLAVDRSSFLDDDAVKVAVECGRIVHVGKVMPPDISPIAESIGLARIDQDTARHLFPLCADRLRDGGQHDYYEAAFQELIARGANFQPADVTGMRWVEIDDHEDLNRAGSLFVAS